MRSECRAAMRFFSCHSPKCGEGPDMRSLAGRSAVVEIASSVSVNLASATVLKSQFRTFSNFSASCWPIPVVDTSFERPLQRPSGHASSAEPPSVVLEKTYFQKSFSIFFRFRVGKCCATTRSRGDARLCIPGRRRCWRRFGIFILAALKKTIVPRHFPPPNGFLPKITFSTTSA